MDLKKLGKMLLFPHMAVLIVLLPVSVVFLVYSMVLLEPQSLSAVVSYVLAAYTLTAWCFRIPSFIRWVKEFKRNNRYVRRWFQDTRFRINISLYGSLIWNTAYAFFQLGLGVWHHTFWFYSMAGYYLALAVMRFFLVRYTGKHQAGESLREELLKYRACGIIFLFMHLALSLMIFFMVYWNRTFHHHEITTIAMAVYTFGALATAIVNVVKYRKYNSPVYSASKVISLAAACVLMLTLESTMLTTFGNGTMTLTARRIMLGITGGVVSVLIIVMAVYMIIQSNQKLKNIVSGGMTEWNYRRKRHFTIRIRRNNRRKSRPFEKNTLLRKKIKWSSFVDWMPRLPIKLRCVQ